MQKILVSLLFVGVVGMAQAPRAACPPTDDADVLSSCLAREIERGARLPIRAAGPLPEGRARAWIESAGSLMEQPSLSPQNRARLLARQAEGWLAVGDRETASSAFRRAVEAFGDVSLLHYDADGTADGPGWNRVIAGDRESLRHLVDRVTELTGEAPNIGEDRASWLADEPPGASAGTAIRSTEWFEPLPDRMLRGLSDRNVRLSLAEMPGEVKVVDFWASWCAPCRKELPRIEALAAVLAEEGVPAEFVTVNVDEDPAAGKEFADSIGLGLPTYRSDGVVTNLLGIESLPTLIIADAHGAVRHRWDGYHDGLERSVDQKVRALIESPTELKWLDLGKHLDGPERLRPIWAREVLEALVGVDVMPGTDTVPPRVVGAFKRAMLMLDPLGRVAGQTATPPFNGRVVSRRNGASRVIVGFRPGGTKITLLESSEASRTFHDVGSPVFAAEVVDGTEVPTLLIGTLDGLVRWTAEGGAETLEGYGLVSDLGRRPEGGYWVLEAGHRVSRLDADLQPVDSMPVPADAWAAFGGVDERFGTVGESVRAVGLGALLEGGAPAIAVLTDRDEVWVFDGTGRRVHRSHWPAAADLTVADLDLDGRAELVMVAGPRVVVSRLEPVAGGDGAAP